MFATPPPPPLRKALFHYSIIPPQKFFLSIISTREVPLLLGILHTGEEPNHPHPLFTKLRTEARRAQKIFWVDWDPPYLRVWMTPFTPLSQGLDMTPPKTLS